jgi:hypothetical protein
MSRNVARWAGLTFGLLLMCLLAVGVQEAQAKGPKPNKAQKTPEAVITATGRLVIATVGSEKAYTLQDATGVKLYYLEAGPRWYYGSSTYPLDKYANQQVTVVGVVEGAKQNKAANPKANPNASKAKQGKPADAPTLEVYTINGETIRGAGKPPWAGGPKNVPNHPGSRGKGHNKP